MGRDIAALVERLDGLAAFVDDLHLLAEQSAGEIRKTRDELLAVLGRTAAPVDASGSTRPWTDRLTARELEVATLAGTGLSSPDIGRLLFLSARTVDNHLGRIYRKLGVANRIALARLLGEEVRT
jgi:DNA-binding NarL/FixJ family response regulator